MPGFPRQTENRPSKRLCFGRSTGEAENIRGSISAAQAYRGTLAVNAADQTAAAQ